MDSSTQASHRLQAEGPREKRALINVMRWESGYRLASARFATEGRDMRKLDGFALIYTRLMLCT